MQNKSNTDNKPSLYWLLTLANLTKVYFLIYQDGDGILTAEEYRRTFHEHGLFVGKFVKSFPWNKVEIF